MSNEPSANFPAKKIDDGGWRCEINFEPQGDAAACPYFRSLEIDFVLGAQPDVKFSIAKPRILYVCQVNTFSFKAFRVVVHLKKVNCAYQEPLMAPFRGT